MKTSAYFIVLSFTFIITAISHASSEQKDSIYSELMFNLKRAQLNDFDDLIALRNYELGNYFFELGLLTQAVAYYNDALVDSTSLKKDTLYINLNNQLGQVYLTLNDNDVSEAYFKAALMAAEKTGNLKGEAESKSLLGHFYEKHGQYLKALKYQNESLEIFEALQNDFRVAMVYENIGSIYEDLSQFEKAESYFQASYAVFKGTKSRFEVNILNNLGDVYRKKGTYELSIPFTRSALELSLELNNNDLIHSAYKDLSKAYALIHEYEKAYANRLLSEAYEKKALTTQNQSLLSALQAEYDAEKKEAQIQLLIEQNKLSKTHESFLIYLLLASMLLFSILGSYYYKKRKAKLKLKDYQKRALKVELEKKALEEKDLHEAIQLKNAALSKYSLHVSQKNELLENISKELKHLFSRKNSEDAYKIKSIVKRIDFDLNQESEWDEFNNIFSEIHPDFTKKLSTAAKDKLTPSELKLGRLLRLNMSSKEIASILRVTPDSVRVARYRLRKKLPINPKAELVNFLLEL